MDRMPPVPNPVTLDHIEAITKDAFYYQPHGSTLTVCMVRLPNGFIVTGASACADPAQFNAELGRQLALSDARRQVWPLEGYRLRQRLHEAEFAAGSAR